MEIEYKGANAVTIKSGSTLLVADPKLSIVGLKDVKISGAIQVTTEKRFSVSGDEKIHISGPGEYEVSDISIKGIAAQRHIDEAGQKTTIYSLVVAGFRIALLGNIADKLSEDQLEALGVLDIVILPVGGNGYTLDAQAAAGIIRQIGPKIVIPIHYNDSALSYEVPQGELADFLKEIAVTEHDVVDKFKLKAGAALPGVLSVVEVTRT